MALACCDCLSASVAVFTTLLFRCVTRWCVSLQEERLPLHLACELGAPTELVRVLLDHNDGAREEIEPTVWSSSVNPPRNASYIVETNFKRDCVRPFFPTSCQPTLLLLRLPTDGSHPPALCLRLGCATGRD